MKSLKYFCISALLLAAVNARPQIDINTLKAAYTVKFTNFIEWVDSEKMNSFIIGYFEEDKYIKSLKDYVNKSRIKDLPVTYIKLESNIQILDCNMVCFNKPDNEMNQILLNSIKDKSILVIGHCHECGMAGFHINFYLQEDKLKFEINQNAMKQSGFKVSYHLLNLARLIPEENSGK